MDSFDNFIRNELSAFRSTRLLVISHSLPDALYSFEGDLAYVGYSKPSRTLSSLSYTVRIVDNEHDILAFVRALSSRWQGNFDIIILDTDHTAATLAAQINAVQNVRTAETVFLFPGATPPRRSIGSSQPTEAWWTGDVWTLSSILTKTGAHCLTSNAAPVGFLMATSVSAIDVRDTVREASLIQERIINDLDMANFINIATNAHIIEHVSAALGGLLDRNYLRVVFDPAEPDVRSSRIIDTFKAWTRPSPAFVIDLSHEHLDVSRLHQSSRSIQGVTLDQFKACHVLGRDVILCGYGEGQTVNCYGRNVYPEVTRANFQLLADDNPARGDLATFAEMREGVLCVPRTLLDGAEPLDTPVFLATPDEHRNYGMWLLYSVPGIRLFRESKEYYPKILAFQGYAWQRRMLIELGVEPEEIIEQRGECTYRCSGLATMRQTYRSLALSATDLDAFDDFGERAVHRHATGPKRIFISRLSHTRAGGYRGLQNEQTLIDRLSELDFAVVEPEVLSLNEQARIFRNADVIVGLGGAAMFNVAFCRPGVKVVDIESGMLHVDAHANLFASRGADYGIIFGQTDKNDPRVVHKRWSIDIEPTLAAIRAFL